MTEPQISEELSVRDAGDCDFLSDLQGSNILVPRPGVDFEKARSDVRGEILESRSRKNDATVFSLLSIFAVALLSILACSSSSVDVISLLSSPSYIIVSLSLMVSGPVISRLSDLRSKRRIKSIVSDYIEKHPNVHRVCFGNMDNRYMESVMMTYSRKSIEPGHGKLYSDFLINPIVSLANSNCKDPEQHLGRIKAFAIISQERNVFLCISY